MEKLSDIAIIGSGILGTSLAYFLSYVLENKTILVIDQAPKVAYHTSGRNTGKVHAPFLYDPDKKKHFAKAAYLGFEMWETFAKTKNLPFKKDGILEVAADEKGVKRLETYVKWGKANGLQDDEIQLLDKHQVTKMEPEVNCMNAIYCTRDASVDYAIFTKELVNDCQKNGVKFLLNNKVKKISDKKDCLEIKIEDQQDTIKTKFLINVAGGNSIDIAHHLGVAKNLTDIHFRGEYWRAGHEYDNLTKTSVYSVPKHPEYPFLDPHWIIRVDDKCEVGPNAVPVFSPYGYDWTENLTQFFPKLREMLDSGAKKILFDRKFLSLASEEFLSSLSKTVMINRVREFLPKIRPGAFNQRGTSGIRSSVIDEKGNFVPDAVIQEGPKSLHVVNYNSPGATGALPFAIYLIKQMKEDGFLEIKDTKKINLWNFDKISEKLSS